MVKKPKTMIDVEKKNPKNIPTAPWKLVKSKQNSQQQRWTRNLDGEEIWMTWQEVHQKGFMVLTAGFAMQCKKEISFNQFIERIKNAWIQLRKSLPMIGCKFIQQQKTRDYIAIEYTVPNTNAQAQQWSDKTVIVKRKGEYNYEKETDHHPDRPDHHVAMLRVLEGGGWHINNETDTRNDNNHLILFTVSHAMADIYTLCDVGRLLLDFVGEDSMQVTDFIWGNEISALPTSLTSAYKHFLGKRTAADKRKSARYWGNGILPILRKKYCTLPINEKEEAAGAHRFLSRLSVEESMGLLLLSKEKKISLTALTYGALAFELENISNRNGTNHCVGIVRNNRRFFPVPLKHEFPASPSPAGTMSFIEIPLSSSSLSGRNFRISSSIKINEEVEEKALTQEQPMSQNEKQLRILELANSFSIAIKSHTEGTAAELGLANIDALTKPYTALLQHNTAVLLAWLPRIWSTKTIGNVIRTSRLISKNDKSKPPPLTMSAHGDLDQLLPKTSKTDPLAEMTDYRLFTRPGENSIAVLTYTYHGQFHMRIVHNTKYYDPKMIEGFVEQTMAHLRSFTCS